MSTTPETPETPAYEPHPYVSQGVSTWRTCAVCGAGANAQIHKADRR